MERPTLHPVRRPAVAAFALVALTFAGCGSGSGSGSGAGAGAGQAADAPSSTSTDLTVPAASSASRCMTPNVPLLATQDAAFEGTVTDVADGTATLRVDRWFKGGESETVTVSAPNDQEQALLQAVDFRQGQTYLVSSTNGQLSVCGMSAPKDDGLAELYEQAYGD